VTVVLPDGCEWLDPPPGSRGEAGVLHGHRYADWVEICKQRPGSWLRISTKSSGVSAARRKTIKEAGLDVRAVQKRTDGTNGLYIRVVDTPTAVTDQSSDAAAIYANAKAKHHSDPLGQVADSLGIPRAKARNLLGQVA
jgi:hypothetical protein